MTFCQQCEREHQPRESAVRCQGCGQVPTWSPHGLCGVCEYEEYQAKQDLIGDMLMLRSLERRER